jgi:uncharacterized membrane protein YkoI
MSRKTRIAAWPASVWVPAILLLASLFCAVPAGAAEEARPRIGKEQAGQNALRAIPGKVTDITVERKLGKNVYVVEVIPDKDGEETDVLIDMESGKILGTER